MKFYRYSHCAGDRSVSKAHQRDIEAAIAAITVKPVEGSATKIRDAFLTTMKTLGWSGEVQVSKDSDMTITSGKGDVGLCLQTGNVARIYADIIKLQVLYFNNAISSAAIVVPSPEVARIIGKNLAQAKRLERELEIFKKAYHVPTLVYALE
ncbi:hypothetical protein LJR290_003452 [Variovorax sp. LjRoot290]|uniref:hypothetical protein n=1 Tax=Variovorax sp. LjRoot290 TaxID=3342316 RepID=UPI003ECD3428